MTLFDSGQQMSKFVPLSFPRAKVATGRLPNPQSRNPFGKGLYLSFSFRCRMVAPLQQFWAISFVPDEAM